MPEEFGRDCVVAYNRVASNRIFPRSPSLIWHISLNTYPLSFTILTYSCSVSVSQPSLGFTVLRTPSPPPGAPTASPRKNSAFETVLSNNSAQLESSKPSDTRETGTFTGSSTAKGTSFLVSVCSFVFSFTPKMAGYIQVSHYVQRRSHMNPAGVSEHVTENLVVAISRCGPSFQCEASDGQSVASYENNPRCNAKSARWPAIRRAGR